MNRIDLRSDTVTLPTDAMRAAMARAEVGDDVYGEDPTVRRLEERAAALLGMEAAVFVASGTMANQVCLGALARGGDEVLVAEGSHCVAFEGGALAALWGVQPRALPARRGVLDAAAVEAAIHGDNDHLPRTRAVSIENTHNRGGGAVWPLAAIRAVAEVARRRGLALHVDGARLPNACAASGASAAELCAGATTATLCLSKGLGAPAGSLAAGPAALAKELRRNRKRLGGGMRQAGLLAAAGLHAIEHHWDRIAEDHANARRLGEGLASLAGAALLHPVDTNMVFASFGIPAAEAVARLREAGVLSNAEGSRPDVVRFVTHLDVSAEDVDEALRRIAGALRGAARPAQAP
jgi:threonine aldolase